MNMNKYCQIENFNLKSITSQIRKNPELKKWINEFDIDINKFNHSDEKIRSN